MLTDFSEFLKSGTQIIVAVLYIIGVFLKRIKRFPDFLIPYMLVGVGIGLCGWISGLNPTSVIQGVLAAGSAVLIHQCYKQSEKIGQ